MTREIKKPSNRNKTQQKIFEEKDGFKISLLKIQIRDSQYYLSFTYLVMILLRRIITEKLKR